MLFKKEDFITTALCLLLLIFLVVNSTLEDPFVTIFFNIIGTIIGGACTLGGVYWNNNVIKKQKIEEEKKIKKQKIKEEENLKKEKLEEEKISVKYFKEILSKNILPKLSEKSKEIDKYINELQGNNRVFLYLETYNNPIEIPTNIFFNNTFFSKTLPNNNIEIHKVNDFISELSDLNKTSIMSILEVYNKSFTAEIDRYNTIYHQAHIVDTIKPENLPEELEQLKNGLSKTITTLNNLAIEQLKYYKKKTLKVEQLIQDILVKLPN